MSAQSRGLGKGLGALIPTSRSEDTEPTDKGLLEVPVGDIVPNPRQPRTHMDPASLDELAKSIREHGLIQPLIVTRTAPSSRRAIPAHCR